MSKELVVENWDGLTMTVDLCCSCFAPNPAREERSEKQMFKLIVLFKYVDTY